MTPGSRLVAALALVFGVATAALPGWSGPAAPRSHTTTQSPSAAVPPAASEPRASTYVGSAACQRCHDQEYSAWRRSLHVKMTKPIAEALVAGDFSGARLEQSGRTYTMDASDGRYYVSIAHGSAPGEKFEVTYALGSKRYQGYLSRLPDGRIYVLPVFWHVESRRWIDWREITPVPSDDHEYRQIWNVNCFNCHATNIARNYDLRTSTFSTTWTEMGIGCEACHGPGKAHLDLMVEWEADPSRKPAYDNRSSNRALGPTLRIFSPRSADPRQVFDACGYCHGNKNNVFTGFTPGDRFEDYALPFLISQPIPDNDPQGEFWPDGRASRFNRPQMLTVTGCFRKGQITCTNCHVAHGSRHEHSLKVAVRRADGSTTVQSDGLCTQCHKNVGVRGSGERLRPTPSAEARGVSERGEAPLRLCRALSSDGQVVWQRASGASPAEWWGPASAEKSLREEPHTTLTATLDGPEISKHTHHSPESAGSRCVECHMSDVNWRLIIRRRDHTFVAPVPEMTARYGVPNACTTCHDDRPPEWAAGVMDRWYDDGGRRRAVVKVADAMYMAGSGDPAALPALVRIAVDRNQGALMRASAAEFIGRLMALGDAGALRASGAGTQTSFVRADAPAADAERPGSPLKTLTLTLTPMPVAPLPAIDVVNALIGAAADPEPMVRITAVRALGLIGDRRALMPLVARLADEARVVRASAADALLHMGVTALDGRAGVALARAQDEYADSLRTFPDLSADHTSLAWLEAARGRAEEAGREFAVAIALDPADPRPRVLRGVVAARAGRYEDALRDWQAARKLRPVYPNIDRLIEEARKRIDGK